MIHSALPADRPLVIFTDLDGTLIDHYSYETRESEAAVQTLAARRIPLVFCSSKTFAEQVHLQRLLGINQPFIFENGSAAAIPAGFFSEQPYSVSRCENGYDIVVFAHADAGALRSVLAQIEGIKGFADTSDAELSAATGLAGAALQRARTRWFTETLLTPLNQGRVDALHAILKPQGFVLSRGGRFYTAQSAGVSKGNAARWMMEIFCQTSPQTPCFAAIGDSPNDASMLEVVDLPFLVQRPDESWADMDIPGMRRVEGVGPAGFSVVVQLLTATESI